MMKKYRKRIVSILLSLVMLMGIFSPQVMAAPASDIPSEMLDNVFLDALAYTGFNVQAAGPCYPVLLAEVRIIRHKVSR